MEVIILKQVLKILRTETLEIKKDLFDVLEMIEEGLEVCMPHIRYLSSIWPNLFEIRVKDRGGQFRVICLLFQKNKLYVVHSFRKKTESIPHHEKKTILKRIKEIKA